MSSHIPGAVGSRQARCVRWLGWDRNPLRRASDRAEVAIRLTVLVLLVAAIPVAAIAVGRWADRAVLHQARAQAAASHPARAVLLQQAPFAGPSGPYSSAQVSWAAARWKTPDGAVRTGDVLAPGGARKGSSIPVWVSGSGSITDPPPGRGLWGARSLRAL